MLETFRYNCPHCSQERDAADVARELPIEVLRRAVGSSIGRMRKTRRAGPGRPTVGRCPGCDRLMALAELREHRRTSTCIRDRLRDLRLTGYKVRLEPKEPDPWPDFLIHAVDDNRVHFKKLSTPQMPIAVELGKIADIVVDDASTLINIRLHGQMVLDRGDMCWNFQPSQLGRPIKSRQ